MRRRVIAVGLGAGVLLGLGLPLAQAHEPACPEGTVVVIHADININGEANDNEICLPPAAP